MTSLLPETRERNPFTRPGFIISAALILVLIAAVIILIVIPRNGSLAGPEAVPSASSADASPSTSTYDTAGSICGLPGNKDVALGSAPAATWELVGKVAAPSSPRQYGPGQKDGTGFRTCFSRSPQGALFAAINVVALGSVADLDTQTKLLDKLTVPGSGRDIARAKIRVSPSSAALQIAGFQIASYSATDANVDLAFRLSSGALGHVNVPLRWLEGDWKVLISASGDLVNDPVQLADLNAYILWSGA
ncbi:MAG: hypothetical protein JWP57_4494 [Spirosoma sp.]|nr:hypothetical protein [Spirosoma sp.]